MEVCYRKIPIHFFWNVYFIYLIFAFFLSLQQTEINRLCNKQTAETRKVGNTSGKARRHSFGYWSSHFSNYTITTANYYQWFHVVLLQQFFILDWHKIFFFCLRIYSALVIPVTAYIIYLYSWSKKNFFSFRWLKAKNIGGKTEMTSPCGWQQNSNCW